MTTALATRAQDMKKGKAMTTQVAFRMEPELREESIARADAMGRSFSGHIRHLLRQDLMSA